MSPLRVVIFWSKNPKTTICQNMFYPIFSFCVSVTSCKKPEKFTASICYKTLETYFEPLFVQKPQCNIFPQKNHFSYFKPSCRCNFTQKKVPCIDFPQNLKTAFRAQFQSLLAQIFQNTVFHTKKSFCSILSL